MMSAIFFLILLVGSYAAGSICSAVIVCNFFKLADPRTEGSENPGATNVLRLCGKKYAAIVLFTDILKGFIPVLIAKMFGYSPMAIGFIGFAAVLGHMYPVFFEFKGGKGVATALGVFFGVNLIFGLIMTLIWILVAYIGKYSSLASISVLLAAPILSLFINPSFLAFLPILLLSFTSVYKHKSNYERLLTGAESKLNF
jgi:glycerol-3-phosphate acyltransferase PlsY